MARDGVRGKKSTDLVVYVINEATKLLKGTSVQRSAMEICRSKKSVYTGRPGPSAS